jgi:hypothetical protein
MNQFTNSSIDRRSEALRDAFGRRVAAALTQHDVLQPRHDIDERLRVARDQALARARESRRTVPAAAAVAVGNGTLVIGGSASNGTPWWLRLSSLLPLAVLVFGLVLIDHRYTRSQIEAAAEVDAEILADDLPPDAYRDPGFAEFLKVGRR